jgi:enoyl-CoA hydratase/carnithine racemase
VISGKEGHDIGLASHLSSDPHTDAMTLAREIASKSPDAVRGAKQLMNRLLNDGAAGQFAAERETIHQLIGTPNQAEAVMSHFEKRPASFTTTGLFR